MTLEKRPRFRLVMSNDPTALPELFDDQGRKMHVDEIRLANCGRDGRKTLVSAQVVIQVEIEPTRALSLAAGFEPGDKVGLKNQEYPGSDVFWTVELVVPAEPGCLVRCVRWNDALKVLHREEFHPACLTNYSRPS